MPDHPPRRFTPWEPMDPGKLPPFCSVPPGPVGFASLTAPSVEKGPLGIQGGGDPRMENLGAEQGVHHAAYVRVCAFACVRV